MCGKKKGIDDIKVREGKERGDVLRQMGSVGVSTMCSARLPWQQAQNGSLESRCDKSNITLGGTGVCLSNESALVYQTLCVNGVCVDVGHLSGLWGNMLDNQQ